MKHIGSNWLLHPSDYLQINKAAEKKVPSGAQGLFAFIFSHNSEKQICLNHERS